MEKRKTDILKEAFLTASFILVLFLAGCSENVQSGVNPNAMRNGMMDSGMMNNGMANNNIYPSAGLSTIERSIAGLSSAKANSIVELSENGVYNLEAKPVAKEINGNRIRMFAYNSQIPGPMLKVKQNSAVYINFTNNLDIRTIIHWHGVRVENKFDGVPDVTQEPVMPGESFLYELDFPDEGIYWYHPHLREDMQQELGLYGAIIVEPSDKNYYNEVEKETVLFLDDISMQGKDVTPFYDNRITHTLMGRFGNVMLVNGAESYNLEVQKGDIIRFYIINTANSRTFNFMVEDHKLKIIGSDSGRYGDEFFADSQIIGVSERYIAEVLFENEGLFNIMHKTPEKEYILGKIKVMPSSKEIPEEFYDIKKNQNPALNPEDYKKYLSMSQDYNFELTVDMSMMDMELHRAMMDNMMMPGKEPIEWEDDMPEMNALSTSENIKWVIKDRKTGKQNMDINYKVKQGEIKKIRIFNNPKSMHPMQHPIHIHGQRFLVLSIDGKENKNLAWKDTVLIPSGSTVELLVDFSNPGKWMMHCHIAEHLESGMMIGFTVE